jgi:flavin reductase (DIM6/NTAB) family NADH-FMN oxidoreductase RutF
VQFGYDEGETHCSSAPCMVLRLSWLASEWPRYGLPVITGFPRNRKRPPHTKDTLSNILEMGEFVINFVSLPLSNAMYESSGTHPPEADEFEKAGLTPTPCEVVMAPWVEEAVSMECVLDRVLRLGTDHLVKGRIVRFHVRDELYEDGRIDVARLQPLGRLAGNYTKVETIFELPSEDF